MDVVILWESVVFYYASHHRVRSSYCKDASVCYGPWQFPKNEVEKGVEFDRPGFHHY